MSKRPQTQRAATKPRPAVARYRGPAEPELPALAQRMLIFGAAGLAFGLVLSAYATVVWLLWLIGGSDANDDSYARTVATYIGGGIGAGLVVAILFPLSQWRWGAVFVGFVAAIPVYGGASLAVGHWDLAGVLICALATGGSLGYMWSGGE